MEVFSKYFTKLVHTSAPQIFPGLNRPIGTAGNAGNYSLLQEEMRKISHDVEQATRISESIETGTEDIFRDFDLSTFMEHFRLDALEKTILALAFKLGTRSDLKTKGTLVFDLVVVCPAALPWPAAGVNLDCFLPRLDRSVVPLLLLTPLCS